MLYQSLDLRISEWHPASRGVTVEVLRSPAGEVAPRRIRLDVDPEKQGERLFYTAENGRHLGQLLWESVFSTDIRDVWGRSYQACLSRRRGLRLRLHIDDPHLAQIPWELLYDPAREDHLVYDRHVSVVRYARIPSPSPEPIATDRLTILAVVASPQDQPMLAWEHELMLLQSALQELVSQDRVRLIICEHATAQRLQDSLMDAMPEAVHYIGHGEYDPLRQAGSLILEDTRGRSASLNARSVARLLCRYRTQLAFLNACDTARGQTMGLASALMRGDMPAVVAMQWPVEDQAAMQFARAFYRAVSLDLTMDECMTEGRLAISSAGGEPSDWAAPVLYMRSLSGRLWVREGAIRSEALPPEQQRLKTQAEEPIFETARPLRAARHGELILRRTEMQRVLKIARQPSVSSYIAIFGSQYTGKTTLLLQLREALREQDCVYVDLTVLHQSDLAACLRHIAFEIANQLEAALSVADEGIVRQTHGMVARRETAVSRVFANARVDRIASVADFVAVLGLLATAADKRIILMLDQVDALPEKVTESLVSAFAVVFSQARRDSVPLAKYLLIVAGGLGLQTLSMHNDTLRAMEQIYLSDLDELQISGLLMSFAQQGVPVDQEAAALVHHLTGGHPYLTMRLCAWMSHTQAPCIDRQAIEDAVENLMSSDAHLQETIRRIVADPAADAKLRQILAGARFRFTRTDAALAALELIGVISPSTPVRLRNALYERALREYVLGKRRPPQPIEAFAVDKARARLATARRHLEPLLKEMDRVSALTHDDHAWRSFAAGFFAQVRGLSISARSLALRYAFALILDIDSTADLATWGRHRPGALVLARDLDALTAEQMVEQGAQLALSAGLTLVIMMTRGGDWQRAEVEISGVHGGIVMMHVPQELVIDVIQDSATVESFLTSRFVLAQRLRQP